MGVLELEEGLLEAVKEVVTEKERDRASLGQAVGRLVVEVY